MTSRGRVAQPEMLLGPLGPTDGAAVLTFYAATRKRLDQWAARSIVEFLGGHALGLTLAAGLTTLPTFTDYPTLLAQLRTVEPDRLEAAASMLRKQLPAACQHSFANRLLRSFGQLDDITNEILCVTSMLAPTVIPVELLIGIVTRVTNTDRFELTERLDGIVLRGLMETHGPDGYTMHAMTATAIRIGVEPDARRRRLLQAALAEIATAVAQIQTSHQPHTVLRLLPHLRAVVGLLTLEHPWNVNPDVQRQPHETRWITSSTVSEDPDTFQLLHNLCVEGAVDPITAYAVLVGMADANDVAGNHLTALGLKIEACERLAHELGFEDLDTIAAFSNVAVAHIQLGNYEIAQRQHADVYRRRRDHSDLGPFHRDTLTSLNNLAIVRGHLGRTTDEARHHHRVAHRYWTAVNLRLRKVAEPDDPLVLDALNGLAINLRTLATSNLE